MSERRVGPYLVEAELGRGGMGVVYRVRHPDLPRPLALKLILPDVADEEAMARFGREAQVMARVTHPGLVRVHQLGRAPEGPFIVSELIEGEGLGEAAARGGVDARRAAEVVRALADAIGALHSAGIVHRDLKPANVRLRPDGAPVVLDLGIAHDESAERMTRTGQMIGTPAYMAPEQAAGERARVGPPADVYGLGAILFELLAGERPFADKEGMSLVTAVLNAEPRWPATRPERGVPRELDAVCRKAMAKEPHQRYASAAALGEDLARYLAGEVPLAAGEVARERARRRRRAIGAGGAVALLVVAGLGALIARLSDPPARPPSIEQRADGTAAAVSEVAPTPAEELERARDPIARARALARWLALAPRDTAALQARAELRRTVLATEPMLLLREGTYARMRVRVLEAARGPLAVALSNTAAATPALHVLSLPGNERLEVTPTLEGALLFGVAPLGSGAVLLTGAKGRPAGLRRFDLERLAVSEPIPLVDSAQGPVLLEPSCLVVSPGARWVAASFSDIGAGLGQVVVVRADDLAFAWQPRVDFPIHQLLFLSDDVLVGGGGNDETMSRSRTGELVVWDLTRDGDRVVRRFGNPPAAPVYALARHPDGTVLVGTHETSELLMLDPRAGADDPWLAPFIDSHAGEEPTEGGPRAGYVGLAAARAHRRPIHMGVFSRDGERLYSIASSPREVNTAELKVWDVASRERLAVRMHGPVLRSVALHPDGLLTTAEIGREARVLELWPIGPP